MLLLPLRVALVAASTIPITIFISLGLLYCFNFELNTVTLAVLVLTLGMIVDNSIVIIDNYLEKIGEGMSRWHASIESTTHFFKSILSATLAISITFFPFLFTTTGMIHDFLLTFPWAITAVLGVSLLVATLNLSAGTTVAPGGDVEDTNEKIPPILAGLGIAAVVILFVLIAHFKKVGPSLLLFASMLLCLFGTSLGVIIQGVDFGVTCFLGIVAQMGIIVRNGIIMFDYAEELRAKEHMHVRDAIYQSARRRMRPIFLTSAAASMGVIPMILGKSGLWMPMGTVICYGTLITMVLLLTVLPVAYYICFRGSTKRRAKALELESM